MPSIAAGLVVFFTSAAVLVLEILAGRLLAPYVGVTLQTYTGIIGTVLAGIAVGSWYGGRLADRVDPRLLLGPMVILGGVLALFTIPLITFFGAAMVGGGVLAILLLSFVGFFAPAAVLSGVTPTVVKLQLASLDETGEVVGRLSALGTAGAILGTFITGFLLVAALPSRPIILAVGFTLVVAGGGLWLWLAPQRDRTPAAMVVLALFAGSLTTATVVPCEVESTYYCANVEEDEARDSGRVLRLDTLRHSYVDLDDPTHLEFEYTKIFGDVLEVTAPAGRPISALHIGGGGFSMPRYIEATRPGSTSRVFELDPTLVQIAEDELGFVPGPDVDVVVGDARLGLRREEPATYDVVIGDAFGGLAVPWHLTTTEFVEQIRDVLTAGGVYMINVIDYPPLEFARAETATLRAVFEHVAVIAPPGRLEGRTGGNVILVASDAPLDLDALEAANRARGGTDLVAGGERVERWVAAMPVLTDDYAPVDQLLTPPVR
jgi:spermidine synthase